MAKMRVLGPRMKNLQETYKDDREKLGRAMMDLYKREKINPLAGCLPILIQCPCSSRSTGAARKRRDATGAFRLLDSGPFVARSVLRVAIIMAGAMFVQYKLNPTPPDPIQAKYS